VKVGIGVNLQTGPWGGGNQVGHALVHYLRAKGVEVVFDLKKRDLDLILLMEPRRNLRICAFSDEDIVRYLLVKHWRTIVVHRINECDERKGTTGVNRVLLRANRCADHTVFVSTWLRDLFVRQDLPCRSTSVILNGSDRMLFNSVGYVRWDKAGPLKFVTHHWGAHWMKGFDIYEQFDRLLDEEQNRKLFSFTYIGNVPEGFRFRNVCHVRPVHGVKLAEWIHQHHVYITASQNEPGSNHQNEGAGCGLPLLYRESGCLPEYCNGFGLSFRVDNFEEKLREMMATYDVWADRMEAYPHKAERMCGQYFDLFQNLVNRRDAVIRARTTRRSPGAFLWALLPRSIARTLPWRQI
jgi:hypothetical protein